MKHALVAVLAFSLVVLGSAPALTEDVLSPTFTEEEKSAYLPDTFSPAPPGTAPYCVPIGGVLDFNKRSNPPGYLVVVWGRIQCNFTSERIHVETDLNRDGIMVMRTTANCLFSDYCPRGVDQVHGYFQGCVAGQPCRERVWAVWVHGYWTSPNGVRHHIPSTLVGGRKRNPRFVC